MATLADLFGAHYRADGRDIDFSSVRIHPTGADRACRALRARAFTVGSDIYFADGEFAPHTREGLRVLAHEVAHVVQRWQAAEGATTACAGLVVAPAGATEEREADAAADALLAGRPFAFAAACAQAVTGLATVRRYMGWEHSLLGDMDPAAVQEAAAGRPEHIDARYALLEELGQDPRNVDVGRLRAGHPGLDMVRLPGSGLVVTLGELNVLPDYLALPGDIETAPAAFLEPVLQSVRSLSIAELRRSVSRPRPRRPLRGSLRYPRLPWLTDACEAMEVDALGRRCGFPPSALYTSLVGRNAAHFAPFSWHRWRSFHLMARDLMARSRTADGDERDALRVRARIYAGYADHFLQDSYAAGHLVNKTLVMQWYIEWLAGSRIPYPGKRLLASMTAAGQPLVHGPGRYDRAAPGSGAADPQTAVEAATLEERIDASGVVGDTEQERREAYEAYLAMLGSSVAQLAAGAAHAYLNKRSLMVAAGPDGAPFRLYGDGALLASAEGARRAAAAAAASRRAITELMERGGTEVTSREIFEGFPDHVAHGDTLISLQKWHDGPLRDLCFGTVFAQWHTRLTRVFLSVAFPRFGTPSADIESLRRPTAGLSSPAANADAGAALVGGPRIRGCARTSACARASARGHPRRPSRLPASPRRASRSSAACRRWTRRSAPRTW